MECRPNFAYGSCNCLLCLYQQQIVFTIWVQLEISQSCNKRRPSLSTCIPSFDVVCYGRIMIYTRTMTLRSEILESWTWKRPTWTYQQHKLHSSAAGVFSSHHLNFVFAAFFPRHFCGLCHQRSFGNEDELVWWLIDFRSSFSRSRPRGKISGEYYFDYTAPVAYNAIIFRSLTIIVTKFSTTLLFCPGRPFGFRVGCQIINLR